MYSMNYIGKFISNFRDFYNEINAATLTGAIDVVVVEQPDGSFNCSPFHVRFGKLGVLRSREKVVDIEINGEARQIHMKLGDSGEAFFVEEVSSDGSPTSSEIPPHLACSPIPDDSCFPPSRFNQLLSNLPPDHHEKMLRDSVMSIEREKWNEMLALPEDQRENFLRVECVDMSDERRTKWLEVASLPKGQRDMAFKENFAEMFNTETQQIIREQYSALKSEDKERLFEENFPELPAEQREKIEKALLTDWKDDRRNNDEEEEIFDMDNINDEISPTISTPKSFVAVTSSDRIRKISVVNNDFRSITDDPAEVGNKEKSSDESNTSLSKSCSKNETEDVKGNNSNNSNNNSNNSKRKRKRKSVMKKKGSLRKSSNGGSSSQTEVSECDLVTAQEELQIDFGVKELSQATEADVENVDLEHSQLTSHASLDDNSKATPAHVETDFHFFSDTEVTKNRDSRPSSPVQSDTEFEMRKIVEEGKERAAAGEKTHQQSWRWGELPSPPPEAAHPSHRSSLISSGGAMQTDPEAHRSMLSGMFSFMKKTSRVRHNPESEGIYLSDLNADELDPEVAALYFPSSHRGPIAKEGQKAIDEEDTESGNGPSLPQSPNSVEGAICGPKSLDSDFEEPKNSLFDSSIDISMSLCGGLDTEHGPSDEMFSQHLLSYEDVCSDPKLYDNPNLVVRVNGKYYNWAIACPMVATLAVFQRQLPQSTVESLCSQYNTIMTIHDNNSKNQSILDARGGRKQEVRSGYSSWFSWGRSSQSPKKPDMNNGQVIAGPENNKDETSAFNISDKENQEIVQVMSSEKPMQIPRIEATPCEEVRNITNLEVSKETEVGEGYSGSEDSDSNINEPPGVKIPIERRSYYESTEKYRKTLRLSSEQIKSLNLNEGPNEVVFSVTTAYQGTTRCKCHIYRWRWDDKIVISDIDGTITKSDVLGHILPIVGKDWAQSGVAQLFTKIKNNGYKLLYLSARAIGQARVTREYLKSIRQGDLSLPEGPLLLNPTSLISAFHREVIEKKPEEFKISCLSDIQALFPEDSKPFYAGYGNRINDVWAYRAVGIPIMRIFTINPRGELKHELTQTFQSSYSNMSFIVDHLFPMWREDAADEFSSFAYWREPIFEVPMLEATEAEKPTTQ